MCNGINLRKAPANCDVVIPMMTILDEALMEAGSFRLVQQWGSGLEGVDLDATRARGIWVANVPASGNNADSVAEHALLLTLALRRQLPAAQANVRTGALGAPLGRMLAGRTVCLYGLGATARALAHRLRPMGVRLEILPHLLYISDVGGERDVFGLNTNCRSASSALVVVD